MELSPNYLSRSCNLGCLIKDDYQQPDKATQQKLENLTERVNQISIRLDTLFEFLNRPQFQLLEKEFKEKIVTDLVAPIQDVFQEIYPNRGNSDGGLLENAILHASQVLQPIQIEVASSCLNKAFLDNKERPFLVDIKNLDLKAGLKHAEPFIKEDPDKEWKDQIRNKAAIAEKNRAADKKGDTIERLEDLIYILSFSKKKSLSKEELV